MFTLGDGKAGREKGRGRRDGEREKGERGVSYGLSD